MIQSRIPASNCVFAFRRKFSILKMLDCGTCLQTNGTRWTAWNGFDWKTWAIRFWWILLPGGKSTEQRKWCLALWRTIRNWVNWMNRAPANGHSTKVWLHVWRLGDHRKTTFPHTPLWRASMRDDISSDRCPWLKSWNFPSNSKHKQKPTVKRQTTWLELCCPTENKTVAATRNTVGTAPMSCCSHKRSLWIEQTFGHWNSCTSHSARLRIVFVAPCAHSTRANVTNIQRNYRFVCQLSNIT